MAKNDDPVRQRVAQALVDLDLDMASVSKSIGKNHAYLFQYLNQGKPAHLPEEVRHALAPILDVPEASLRSREIPSAPPPLLSTFVTSPRMRLPAWSNKDLPVYASAEGGPGGTLFEATPIDFVIRPDPLANVRDGYAIYMVASSMSPAFDQGDLILIHPHLPPRPDAAVLLYRRSEDGLQNEATVARLQRAGPDHWQLEQFNPAKLFTLPRREWPSCDVIVGKYSRG